MKLYFRSILYSFNLLYKTTKYMVVVYWIAAIMCSTLTLSSTLIIKHILEGLAQESPEVIDIIFWVGLYIGVILISLGMNSIYALIYNSIFAKAREQYNQDVLEKMNHLPISFVDSAMGKNVVSDVRYTTVTAVHLADNIVRIITYIYTFIVTFAVLLKFHAWFALLFLLLTIPSIVMRCVFDKKSENFRMKTAPDMRKFSYYRWMLTDAYPAKDVRMYDLTEKIKGRYLEEKKQYIEENKRLDKKKIFVSLCVELIMRLGEIAFTIFVIYKALMLEISIGDVTVYIGFALAAASSFKTMMDIIIFGYTRVTQRMQRMFDFFALDCSDVDVEKRKLKQFESLIFENVYFKYPYTEKYVLSGVSFTLNKGDKLSIVGINGSGKSTIIKLMLGLYEIESGQIFINGYPMSDYNIREVRKLFSALFQSFVQYPLTLRENIALSSLERIDDSDEIERVLRQSGVYEDIQPKLENGLDSFMTRKFDDKGTELSKGQWQKIALSRAYFKNAPIIIFDEPSAALDAEAEDRIFKNFESISDGKTGIMISHRISSARMSNKIIVLDGGKITEQGTHEELVSLNGLYAKLYNLQRKKYTVKEGD